MLEQALRHHYQKILVDPILGFITHHASPLSITYLSGISGLLFLPFLLLNKPVLAIFCLLISGYLDTLDGSLARYQNSSSNFGSVMDIVMDRVVEFVAIFALYLADPLHRALLVVLMLGSILLCITSFLVVGIFTSNDSQKSFHYSPGLMERAEAFIFFIAMALLPTYFTALAIVFCCLVCSTAVIRLYEFKNQIKD